MDIKKIICCALVALNNTQLFASPQLIELQVYGSQLALEIEPKTLTLEANQEYVFLVQNQKDYSIQFNFGQLGQHVTTQMLSGTGSVTQDGFEILANSKLTWHFFTQKPGNYSVVASNISYNQKSNELKLEIKGELPQAEQKASTEALEVTVEAEPSEEELAEAKEKADKEKWFTEFFRKKG
jgi:hypothetical protein